MNYEKEKADRIFSFFLIFVMIAFFIGTILGSGLTYFFCNHG